MTRVRRIGAREVRQPPGGGEKTMGRRIAIAALTMAVLSALTVGIALASSSKTAPRTAGGERIHVVIPAAPAQLKFNDFDNDGLTLGDTLTVVSRLLDGRQSHRVGIAYAECVVAGRVLREGTPYDCTYVLKLEDGTITTQGLDPHGASDVFFAITGGTGAYQEASGQAEYIDTSVTDIYIHLDE
jgi:hypothetical protein